MYPEGEITPDFVNKTVASGRQYCIVFLNAGPSYNSIPGEQQQKLQMDHLIHLFTLKKQGHILLVGPLIDNPVTRGIAIFNSENKEEVRKYMEADPAVKAGRHTFEIYHWFGIPGDKI
ncbi:MAG: YciI family protein [Bacteroidia bacterium]